MSEQRAEGFWWVRWRALDGSEFVGVAHVRDRDPGLFFWPGLSWGQPFEKVIEWGPYLGKEPETIESLDRKIADMMAAAVPRFEVFESGKAVLAGATRWRGRQRDASEPGVQFVSLVEVPLRGEGKPRSIEELAYERDPGSFKHEP